MPEKCEDEIEKIYYLSPKLALKPRPFPPLLECITVKSTQDLLDELTQLLTTEHIDAVVHSAAVGDYKARYSIRAEDLIDEIIRKQTEAGGVLGYDQFMEIFDTPEAVQNDSTKISSYEPHLMTMLTLTPKVIGNIKKLSPQHHPGGLQVAGGCIEGGTARSSLPAAGKESCGLHHRQRPLQDWQRETLGDGCGSVRGGGGMSDETRDCQRHHTENFLVFRC